MMREQYWGLFWDTGMPEAWLMSRGRMGITEAARQEGKARQPDIQPSPPDDIPGDPGGVT